MFQTFLINTFNAKALIPEHLCLTHSSHAVPKSGDYYHAGFIFLSMLEALHRTCCTFRQLSIAKFHMIQRWMTCSQQI
jgi:hypothetical protein